VLAAHVADSEADACYENLCLLYVAMTRAKRALYVITEPVGKSQSHNFPRLLQETLGESWSTGDPAWFGKIPPEPRPAEGDDEVPTRTDAPMPRAPRRPARRPSAERTGAVVSAAPLFALDHGSAASFGASVHALLAEVEWCGGPADGGRLEAAWQGRGVDSAAVAAAISCLRAPGLGGVWTRPVGKAEVWRERSFEAVLDGAWVTGIFDRVVVVRDEDGRPVSVRLFDFKTDRVATPAGVAAAAGRHRAQLELYRRAAGALTGIDPSAVSAEIVFTHPLRIATL
jgi:hypothetical protein